MRKLAVALCFAVSAVGSQIASPDEQQATGDAPKGEVSKTLEFQATVAAIDQKTRIVTLKTPDGKESTFYVDERVRNLPQVKVGDEVRIAYVVALAWKLNKSRKAAPSPQVETNATRAEPGAKPAGGVARRISFTASIESIDLANGTVTLKGPEGNSRTLKARNPDNLKKVKVGDLVDITYTESVAVKLEPAPK
jgi:Cu/Ag efflux protein CusF